MTALELRGVSKVYGEGPTAVHAIRGIDLSVDAGELVAVMGPSGSGKSTLLTIAGSLEEPTSGAVLVDGVPLSGLTHNDRARMRRRSIGYVFQDFNLLAGLTAVENVSLPLELDGVASKAARAAGMTALEELDLGDRAERFPDELSGGERQRVAIARAVVGRSRNRGCLRRPSGVAPQRPQSTRSRAPGQLDRDRRGATPDRHCGRLAARRAPAPRHRQTTPRVERPPGLERRGASRSGRWWRVETGWDHEPTRHLRAGWPHRHHHLQPS